MFGLFESGRFTHALMYIKSQNGSAYFCSLFQNHWFTYNEKMTVESVTQAVSNLALQFGDDKAEPGAMVCKNSHDFLTPLFTNEFFHLV